ncbi:MAG: hypothetical protein NTX75_11615 [Proteobacteria bacterium]|nr:hypothetical protein [Pseudomonadota bacterium]
MNSEELRIKSEELRIKSEELRMKKNEEARIDGYVKIQKTVTPLKKGVQDILKLPDVVFA